MEKPKIREWDRNEIFKISGQHPARCWVVDTDVDELDKYCDYLELEIDFLKAENANYKEMLNSEIEDRR